MTSPALHIIATLCFVTCLGACGGSSTIDGDGSGEARCPTELVGDNTECAASDEGLECDGEGSDSECSMWSCYCEADGTFECYPGECF